jgi:hypothetical protein
MQLALSFVVASSLAALLVGCQGPYMRFTEQHGFQQRDVFVNGIEVARNSQEEARGRFLAALATFSQVVKFRDGELQSNYQQFDDEFAETRSSAEDVRAGIESVQNVAQRVFADWQSELDNHAHDDLRRLSQRKLEQARHDYSELVGAMRNVEVKMVPILVAFQDQLLFLKHNLNPQAIAALDNELEVIRAQTAALIEAMDVSIAEADSFVNALDWV